MPPFLSHSLTCTLVYCEHFIPLWLICLITHCTCYIHLMTAVLTYSLPCSASSRFKYTQLFTRSVACLVPHTTCTLSWRECNTSTQAFPACFRSHAETTWVVTVSKRLRLRLSFFKPQTFCITADAHRKHLSLWPTSSHTLTFYEAHWQRSCQWT